MAARARLQAMVEPFSRSRTVRAVVELSGTLASHLALTVAMMLLVRAGHPWGALALSVPTAAFLVRTFVIFHDCCHGSFHHVQPRIPFYNLPRCLVAVPAFQAVPPLTLGRSLHSLRLRLVDESRRRMVSWTDVKVLRASRRVQDV